MVTSLRIGGRSVLWPVLYVAIIVSRFGRYSGTLVVDSLVVLPMGVVAGVAFVVLRARASESDQQDAITVGYAAATPVAYFGALCKQQAKTRMMTPSIMEDPSRLVGSFAESQRRIDAYQELVELGSDALPALRLGLRSDNWQIRRWSAICLDHVADTDALGDLLPLLEDPKSEVRLWAVHALACNHCKTDVACTFDVFPYLVKRITSDQNLRVRKMAVIMLATDFLDARAVPVLQRVLRTESDRRIRLHASEGLERARQAGMAARDD